jgi:hypothetical protein
VAFEDVEKCAAVAVALLLGVRIAAGLVTILRRLPSAVLDAEAEALELPQERLAAHGHGTGTGVCTSSARWYT